jgi:hypothetical protein
MRASNIRRQATSDANIAGKGMQERQQLNQTKLQRLKEPVREDEQQGANLSIEEGRVLSFNEIVQRLPATSTDAVTWGRTIG